MTLIIDKKSVHPGMKIPKSLVEDIDERVTIWKSLKSQWVTKKILYTDTSGNATSGYATHVVASADVHTGILFGSENCYFVHEDLLINDEYCKLEKANLVFIGSKPFISARTFFWKFDKPGLLVLEYQQCDSYGNWNNSWAMINQESSSDLFKSHWMVVKGEIKENHFNNDGVAYYRVWSGEHVRRFASFVWEVGVSHV